MHCMPKEKAPPPPSENTSYDLMMQKSNKKMQIDNTGLVKQVTMLYFPLMDQVK